MARDQKIKSKVSQGRNKQQVQPAGAALDSNTTQPTVKAKATIPDETQGASNKMVTDTTHETIGPQQVVWTGVQPDWPSWPTSKPGPRSTPPAPGMRSINRFRPEQFKELAYNQETGESASPGPFRSLPDERTTGSTSFDQPTTQDVLGRRKQRL